MKVSNYNKFVQIEETGIYIGYNCLSGGMYMFNEVQYKFVRRILSSPKSEVDSEAKSVWEKLEKGRFIIPESVDELKMLKLKSNISRFNPNGLAMVVTPTLACNFDCPYCYVDRAKESMNRETISKLKKFFKQRIKKTNLGVICWTGGEPLLALDIVEELNTSFKNDALRRRAKLDCNMITNGYLLTKKNISRLKNCGISNLQITLDGSREHHDRTRFTKGEKGTFLRILDNVAEATAQGIKIVLRSNIDKENYDGIYGLIDELVEREIDLNQLVFAPCMVMDIEKGNSDSCGGCFSKNEFAPLEPKILSYAVDKGFKINKRAFATHNTYCGANTMSLFVIDSHANVLKCWCNLGNVENNKIGYISKNGEITFTDHNVLSQWMAWNPFEIEECIKCDILPLCMGGCMYYHIMGKTDNLETACSLRKYNLEEMIKTYYSSLMKKSNTLNILDQKLK